MRVIDATSEERLAVLKVFPVLDQQVEAEKSTGCHGSDKPPHDRLADPCIEERIEECAVQEANDEKCKECFHGGGSNEKQVKVQHGIEPLGLKLSARLAKTPI